MNSLKFALAISTLICLVQSVPAQAQAWPSKPLQMVVPQGAGGSTDAIARLVAQVLGERLGQTVVIDNRAGAGGVLGVAAAAKAAPDGYTLLIGSNTTLAANAFLYASFPVDPLKDFVPLALAADAPFVFVVPAASPLKSVRDLVSAAKAAPGKINYGSGTSSALLCTELFKAAAGVDLLKVPYKSSAQGLTDLIGGQIDVVCEPLSASLPNIRAGRPARAGTNRRPAFAVGARPRDRRGSRRQGHGLHGLGGFFRACRDTQGHLRAPRHRTAVDPERPGHDGEDSRHRL